MAQVRAVVWSKDTRSIPAAPDEGMEITGWPVATVARGRIIIEDGSLHAEPGTGRYIEAAVPRT